LIFPQDIAATLLAIALSEMDVRMAVQMAQTPVLKAEAKPAPQVSQLLVDCRQPCRLELHQQVL